MTRVVRGVKGAFEGGGRRVSRIGLPSILLLFVPSAAAAVPTSAVAQETREEQRAEEQETKAADLHPYVPTKLEQQISRVARIFSNQPPVYVFFGSVYRGG